MDNGTHATVFIADDDDHTRSAIEKTVRSIGLRAEAFSSIDTLIDRAGDQPGCIILDLREHTLAAFATLEKRGCQLPVIVVTGQYDVATTVQVMRAGALNVLGRPLNDQALIDDVHRAIVHDRAQRRRTAEIRELQQRYFRLTRREREVMALVSAGGSNRRVGTTLGIAERTVKAHRAQVVQKMKAASLVDLIHMARDLAGASAARRKKPITPAGLQTVTPSAGTTVGARVVTPRPERLRP